MATVLIYKRLTWFTSEIVDLNIMKPFKNLNDNPKLSAIKLAAFWDNREKTEKLFYS